MVDVFLALFFLAGPTGAVVSWGLWKRLRWSRSEIELLGAEVRSLEQQVAIQQALLLRTLNHDNAIVAKGALGAVHGFDERSSKGPMSGTELAPSDYERSLRDAGQPGERFRRAVG
ncbi:MAG TPA: hypothetical protein VH142_13725 [Polyangiaceae bacterium]|jgi:hypothetical protein|nr:hypothetical protein [Polyangiaceae bacterium]